MICFFVVVGPLEALEKRVAEIHNPSRSAATKTTKTIKERRSAAGDL